MKVTIHVEIGDYHNTSYKKAVLSWMQEKYPHLITFDFDSHSEATVINYGIDLLKQGEEMMIILDYILEGNNKPFLKLFDTLTSLKTKSIKVIYNGQDALLDKLLGVFPDESIMRRLDTTAQK